MKVFSFKTSKLARQEPTKTVPVKGEVLDLKQLKSIKGGQGEGHDLIPSTGVYGGGSEEPPST